MPVLSTKADIRDCSSWFTQEHVGQYYLQENIAKNDFARIVHEDGRVVAIGSKEIMQVKLERLTAASFFTRGDIIAIDRKQNNVFSGYTHYAIYWDDFHVIHFAGKEHDLSGKKYIRFSTIHEFLNANGQRYRLKDCSLLYVRDNKPPRRIYQNIKHFKINMGSLEMDEEKLFVNCKCYDKNKTIARAEAVALQFPNKFTPQSSEEERAAVDFTGAEGFRDCYDLVDNNCEHFALWCRTGLKVSMQVNNCRPLVEAAAKVLEVIADYNRDKQLGGKKYDVGYLLKQYLKKHL